MAGESAPNGTDRALDAITGRATASSRTTYLMLIKSTYTITDSSTFADLATNEITTPTTNGYSRQAVTWTAPADSAGVRRTENEGAITFGPFSADLDEVNKCALVSAATGSTGDFLFFWTMDNARNPGNGDAIQFADAALYITLD